jgi:hypothetical protein
MNGPMSMHIVKFNNFEGLLRIGDADIVEKNGKKSSDKELPCRSKFKAAK